MYWSLSDTSSCLCWKFECHRHGIRQLRTGWADGPAYVTQCPIRGGQSYTYRFTVTDQRGTLLWHAHYAWQRASVYGALIIYPRIPYPFSRPISAEIPIVFGEWWNGDPDEVEKRMMLTGAGPNSSDAYTMNGLPGPLYPCSNQARPYLTSVFPFNNSTTIGFFRYKNAKTRTGKPPVDLSSLKLHNLPAMEDNAFATKFSDKIKSLASPQYPCNVPQTIDKRVITTISLNLQDCPENKTCSGYKGKSFFASMNNQSFVRPSISILESYYKNLTTKSFSADFPEKPPNSFDYTGGDPLTQNMNTEFGTKLIVVPYGTNVEIVLQDTSFLNLENHPIHVHGHNFFIVGSGFGNFNEAKDPKRYNLVDPPERNTVAVPGGGWAAIRIKADNPGVWFIHCHLEQHTSWGLATGFIVQNGQGPSQSMLPPPQDLPPC
ncbi:MULTI-COPPER OXIDASE [Salix koriyanagi]|uniref:MULTI-COPPER OXIDASE n=1 Tax=Salix koriyanagi TaxID=2511006 RepID=A0A9Q0PFL2_9ROSI|nr:MULTI-COPPER OXIDASE [Salix koriyanagi]